MSSQHNVHERIHNKLIFFIKLSEDHVILFNERQFAINFE